MKKITFVLFCVFISQGAFCGYQYQKSLALQKAKIIENDTINKIPLSNSVLATGNWYRFYVEKSGIYKITPQFLSSLGMDISKIDPTAIKIYGNGGQMLPLSNKENLEFDLRENAIKVVGVDDGILSGDDHILFYAEGTKGYNKDSKTHINAYEDRSFYFITVDGKIGSRVQDNTLSYKKADTLITSFTEDQFHEIDQFNLGIMGRRWFGDKINAQEERDFLFHFPNSVDTASIRCSVLAAAQAKKFSKLKVQLNKQYIGEIKFRPISDRSVATAGELTKRVRNTSDSISITLKYEVEKEVSAKSYLDYIRISLARLLIASNKQFGFVIPASSSDKNIADIHLKNAQKISEIWDVTSPEEITIYKNKSFLEKFVFQVNTDQSRKFVVVSQSDYYEPQKTKETKLENQDLKGTIFLDNTNNFKDIDYVIITEKNMLSAAKRLADFHRNRHKLNVKVSPVHEIYNEFSSGNKDVVAIRNFIRYLYENASSDTKKLSFVCFMGNATVDYKNKMGDAISVLRYKKNGVPSFMSYESLSHTRSYISDDFFVMMDPEEGHMLSKDKLDIVIGRILADNTEIAHQVVDKYLRYYGKESIGNWRNNVLLLSDDVDEKWERNIQENLNRLGDSLHKKYPFLNVSKIYSDAYLQKSSFTGERYPSVTKELIERIEKGVAVLDYFGHAEEEGFGTEFFFTKKDAIHLKNKNKLPLFITVTCLATRFDNPLETSIGEYIFKNPNGGGIAMIATTREIFLSGGIQINNKIIEYLFSENGPQLKPAEAVLRLKNELKNRDKRNVFFIGDPMMSLQMPKPEAKITTINKVPVKRFKDTLKALSPVRITGEVIDGSGTIRKDYNGKIKLTIFDKEINRSTVGNDHSRDSKKNIIKLDFIEQSTIIFQGNSLVKNGMFDFRCILPKDINMAIGYSKMSLYANTDNGLEDVFGVEKNILLGGIDISESIDKIGPEIKVFFNDKKEKTVNEINSSSKIRIEFTDESGVNLSSQGIGHHIKMIIDGDESKSILLNDYYINKQGSYKEGYVIYELEKLTSGFHTLEIRAWDTFNNSTMKKIKVLTIDSF